MNDLDAVLEQIKSLCMGLTQDEIVEQLTASVHADALGDVNALAAAIFALCSA